MDPVLAALGFVAESLAVEVALEVVERQRKRGRRRGEVSPEQIQRMLKGAAGRLGEALRLELAGMPAHEWRAAVVAVRDSLAAVTPIATSDVLALDLRSERLEAHVRQHSARIRREAALSSDGLAAYDRILSATCHQIL